MLFYNSLKIEYWTLDYSCINFQYEIKYKYFKFFLCRIADENNKKLICNYDYLNFI